MAEEIPEFIQHRLDVWEVAKKKYEEILEKKGKILDEKKKTKFPTEKNPIKITLPDGTIKEGISFQTTPMDIAVGISAGLSQNVLIAQVGDNFWDLNRPLEGDCDLKLLKYDDEGVKKVFWHSSAHILGQALEFQYNCKLCIGPPTEDGFYYDVEMGDKIVTQADYKQIKDRVNKVVKEKQPYERLELLKEDALEMFKFNPYKLQIISSKVPDGEFCTAYRCGPLIDLCKGPHVPNTGKIKAIDVTKNSSAYWLGKAENDVLQRVYGVSFQTPKQLKEYHKFIEEAKKRDHREIGKKQELFFFDIVSPGSCFFLPHGTRIYNKLVDLMKSEYRKRGFTEVISPNIYSTQLWDVSGHSGKYSENMFKFEVENQDFALKPMNCPGHCVMFKHRARSFRELPLRFADFGVLHRNELSGALSGLTRVRRFQQDDAHIFCTKNQIAQEMKGCFDFMVHVYGIFGFDFELELSTRPEKYIGEIEVWNEAERVLQEMLEQTGMPWKLNPGDGAFYGPKIDVHIKDALKRSFQCATIQLDFTLPERFDLSYKASDENASERPVMIHRAILGSVERFFGILCEHTSGKWPFWISPRQVIICSVSDQYAEYAQEVKTILWNAGYYCDADVGPNTLPKKIRAAQLEQYNFICVVGKEEVEKRTVNIRVRDNNNPKDTFSKSIDELIVYFKDLCSNYK